MGSLKRGDKVLGRYTIDSLMGAGAMGKIYLAEHDLLRRPVAIKILTRHDDETMYKRFDREARVLAQFEHPNVVRVMDFGTLADGSPCMVMELLVGESFEQILDRRATLPWKEALGLILEVLEGLAALHEGKILHRDIKTSNLMLVGRDTKVVKLIDLGIARGEAEFGIKLTQTGTMVGSPAYMAPELLRGEQATVASELYSVGLVFYELLCGQLPFGAQTFADVMRRLNEPVPRHALMELPNALWLYLGEKVLSRVPALRPASAQVMREELLKLQRAAQAPTAGWVNPRSKRSPEPALSAPAQALEEPDAVVAPELEQPSVAAPLKPELKPRALVVARLPESVLGKSAERQWFSELVGLKHRAFAFGAQLRIVVLSFEDDAQAQEHAQAFAQHVEGRYGSSAGVVWAPLDGEFSLSAASLSGLEPLPEQLQALIAALY